MLKFSSRKILTKFSTLNFLLMYIGNSSVSLIHFLLMEWFLNFIVWWLFFPSRRAKCQLLIETHTHKIENLVRLTFFKFIHNPPIYLIHFLLIQWFLNLWFPRLKISACLMSVSNRNIFRSRWPISPVKTG